MEDDHISELQRLRKIAKTASYYHRFKHRFQRNPNLSHIVHACLHGFQFIVVLSVEIFHRVHHAVNKQIMSEDPTHPHIPEETNPIFIIYPACMLISIVFGFMRLIKHHVLEDARIPLAGCVLAAALLLIAGIAEMRHADRHIDLSLIDDEHLLKHPIFIHNFIMCIFSIFAMTIYLLQAWILVDVWYWFKKQKEEPTVSDSVTDTDGTLDVKMIDKTKGDRKEQPGELDPIPSLGAFPSAVTTIDDADIDKQPVILYCCFVDCYNYFKWRQSVKRAQTHEFQVVHVM